MSDLQQLAQHVVDLAVRNGATAADCVIREGREFSTTIRCGEIEQLKEAQAKALGLRVFLGCRSAGSYTSDFSSQGIEQLVSRALAAARVTSEDSYAGLSDPALVGKFAGDLELYHEDVADLASDFMIEQARRAEMAAFAYDPRIKNSEGSSFDSYCGSKVLATSQGFVGQYRGSTCSLSVVPIAVPDAGAGVGMPGMQRDYWYSLARSFSRLESPEQVGRKAAERAVRRLGARKVPTCRVPVVFEPRTARSLLTHLADALNGDAIYRGASFLANRLGQKIASDTVTIVDDGALPGGFGSSPFDDECVRTRRTVIVERGILKNYLLNSYAGRKLGMETTANAARGLAGNPGIGPTNFFWEAGAESPENIIRSIQKGLYITEFSGVGFNAVTGDLSHGAVGLWIENGELAYAVEEITVAGNLQEILQGITHIGTDLEFRGSIAAPTLAVAELTVAGH